MDEEKTMETSEETRDPEEQSPETAPSVTEIQRTQPYHDRYYLLYGQDEPMPELDLSGTRQFLMGLGFDGGELRQAREGKDFAERMSKSDEQNDNNMFCSYCGCEITGVGYNRLPDGRLRCTTCSGTLVRSREELERIYGRIRIQMETFFETSFNVPVQIQFLEERKLKKKLRFSIGEQDDKSILILGVAVNEKKKYRIYLENGAPRMSVIATLVHELTHIWQYTHWKDKGFAGKLTGKTRLVVYEGMAKWAEIQYLYLIGETTVARREEAVTSSREDEYGIGFNLYADQYPICRDAMTCMKTPFIADRCPID